MSHDEIIAMAKEAGIHIDRLPDEYCTAVNLPLGSVSRWDGVGLGELQSFAALVAEKAEARANERANASWKLMCEKMVAAEREACALVCEGFKQGNSATYIDDDWADMCAAAIRARGQKEGA